MLATLEDVVTAGLSAIPHDDTGQSEAVQETESGQPEDTTETEWKTFKNLAEHLGYDGKAASLRKMLWLREPCSLSKRLPSDAVRGQKINPKYWQDFAVLYRCPSEDRAIKAQQIEEFWRQKQVPIEGELVDESSALAEFRGGGLQWDSPESADLAGEIDDFSLEFGNAICRRIAGNIGNVVRANLGSEIKQEIDAAKRDVLGGGNG